MRSINVQMSNSNPRFLQFLLPSKKTILLILAVAAVTLVVSSFVSLWLARIGNLRVPSLGTIKTEGVEAYWDIDLQNKTEEIAWGTLQLGSSKDVNLFLLSISNIPVTLTLTKEDLTFYDASEVPVSPPGTLSQYMNITWNYDGDEIEAGEVIPVALTLRAEYSTEFATYLIEEKVALFTVDLVISTTE